MEFFKKNKLLKLDFLKAPSFELYQDNSLVIAKCDSELSQLFTEGTAYTVLLHQKYPILKQRQNQ